MKKLGRTTVTAVLCALLMSDLCSAAGGSTARIIPLGDHAFSGSSVNVVAGARQTLFTHSIHQYAAYYDAGGFMVLARRRLGEDQWQTLRTQHRGTVVDARNSISLIVDGDGFLHVAWNNHDTHLMYARSVKPGELTLGPPQGMIGRQEDSVTSPGFYRLDTGDLLFSYRDGGSGNGQLVINHYSTHDTTWHRVHDALIDGEGQRSADWDMAIDEQGVLHLAWTWRETPDGVANHDIAYAQSKDDGVTWTDINGHPFSLPITAAAAGYAVRGGQQHHLMSPPVIAATSTSQPCICSSWASASNATPRFNVVCFDHDRWHTIAGPEAAEAPQLAGTASGRPSWSRAALFVESEWDNNRIHLIYRDDAEQGRVIAATLDDLTTAAWEYRYLTQAGVGAWEPCLDPTQATRLRQAQMLVQNVTQPDDSETATADAEPTQIGVLIWSPNWERHQALVSTPALPPAKNLAQELEKKSILKLAEKVAWWQWGHLPANGGHYHERGWTHAPFYVGTLAVAALAPDSPLEQRMLQKADAMQWMPHTRIYDADDHCVMQAYLELYLKYKDKKMLTPSKQRLDYILANPSPSSLDWLSPHARDRWSWSDSLFMGPASWLLAYKATGDERYLEFMNREWQATKQRLYRSEIGLYFRDESYLDVREKNGKTIHWSRGTAWSFAGLARSLALFPRDHPDFPLYVKQLREMADAFRRAQQDDGYWRPGLLDPATHTARETSGTAFITFGLAWGINNGLLEKERFLPTVVKGWNALTNSVTDNGKLENVQPIGAAPYGFDPTNSEPFATGAFLLAASEVYRLAKD